MQIALHADCSTGLGSNHAAIMSDLRAFFKKMAAPAPKQASIESAFAHQAMSVATAAQAVQAQASAATGKDTKIMEFKPKLKEDEVMCGDCCKVYNKAEVNFFGRKRDAVKCKPCHALSQRCVTTAMIDTKRKYHAYRGSSSQMSFSLSFCHQSGSSV